MQERLGPGLGLAACLAAALSGRAAADVSITIENTSPEGGFFLTPFWVGIHEGSFDSYDGGTSAAAWPGLTEMAEAGDNVPLGAAFCSAAGAAHATALAVAGPGDAPVLSPGESVTIVLDEGDASLNRYFSYASMIIPSNDLFVANGNPLAHPLFDAGGTFAGPVTIEIFGGNVNDNGTEVNDAFGGAAFSANGGTGVDEFVPIRNFFTEPGDADYLESFVGTQTVTGVTIDTPFATGDMVARITITESVPTPVRVTVENTAPEGGFFLTPFWIGLHDGGFDSYDGGTLASKWPGLTEMAEEGDTAPLSDAFCAGGGGRFGGVQRTLLAVTGAGDAPVLDPGESVTMVLDAGDPRLNRYFSYASMVIPSNDLFVANGNPTAHAVFDESGAFAGPLTIDVLGDAVNDNGTEVNDAFAGAAFSANGGIAMDETNLIRNFFTMPGDDAYLDSFVGTMTVTGHVIETPFAGRDLVARITVDLACAADLDGSGDVGHDDLAALIANFGATGAPGLEGDVDFDGTVDVNDLIRLILAWGECPTG